jgi:hypothetical protein
MTTMHRLPRLLISCTALLGVGAAAEAEATPGSDPLEQTAVAQAGDAAPRRAAPRVFRPVVRYGADDVLVEAGGFPDAPEASATATLRASPYVVWQPSRAWEFRAGVRLDGVSQTGGAAPYDRWRADLGDTYVRYRDGDSRFTLGAQTIIWGRVDAIPLIDRVSRADLTRFVLDDLAARRRAQWAARWEQSFGDWKFDGVLLPSFRGAALPDLRSVWSPINRHTGEVIGVAPSPALAALVGAAQIREDDGGGGGAALRITRSGGAVDYGLTLARTRQSLPYYRVDPVTPALTAVHPYNKFVGIDMETTAGSFTWRAELGYTDGVPVTLPSTAMLMTSAVEAAGGVEFFPGGKNTRVTLQLAARSLRTRQDILELKRYYGVNGELESTFAQGRWKAGLRFFSGLNVHDLYLAPKLSYLGFEPHELFVVARYFNGEARTLGGFHRDHDMIAVGLSTRF